VFEIEKNIFVIEVPLPGNPLKSINIYLIKGTDRNLMIDTGFNMPLCYETLMRGLKEINVQMKNTDIFLTHLHSDHTGLSSTLIEPDNKIFIGETDKMYMKEFFGSEYWNWLDDKYVSYGFSRRELEENQLLNPASLYLPSQQGGQTSVNDGTIIDLGTYKFKCVETPGHTPGHMCLFDEEKGIFFSGDHIIFDITPNITSWRYVENSLKLYLQSLDKIKTLDISSTFSAHRKPIGDCHARVDELLAHHGRRLEEAYEIVKNNQSGWINPYAAASQMTWSIRARNWGEFPVTQKWFAVGEAVAHLEYLRLEGRISRGLSEGIYYYCI